MELKKLRHLEDNEMLCLMTKTKNIIGILSTYVHKKKIRKIKN